MLTKTLERTCVHTLKNIIWNIHVKSDGDSDLTTPLDDSKQQPLFLFERYYDVVISAWCLLVGVGGKRKEG